MLRQVSDQITHKLNGKQPIIIFEDLDKINPKDAWDVFSNYAEGIGVIIDIVEKRAQLNLFEEDVLETLIEKTGGSLRDLFYTINASAQRAIRRNSDRISFDDIQKALEELKTSLTRRIERKHYDFLVNICKGNRQLIEDKEMLLTMLQANAVLEYNGRRWHNVHPLFVDFLEEQGFLKE